MYLSQKHVPRRTLLRGMGAALALPLLDSMLPAQTALRRTAALPRPRLACIEMVHGAAGSTPDGAARHYWSPARAGADFDLSYTLEPFAPFRDALTIVSNTDARSAEAVIPSEGGADHFRSSAVFLTAAHAKQTAGPDIRNGTSIDQIYAQHCGQDTPLPSIQLAIENIAPNSSCGFNYSCLYSETICWASPTAPLPMPVNPRVVFETLLAAAPGRPAGASVLDTLAPAAARLRRDLGPTDTRRLNDHLDEVRALERRIQAIERRNALAPTRAVPAAPLGVPDSWEEHVRLMFDLQVLAFAADITRVSAFKMSRDTSNRIFPESGVKTPFHTLSHHSEKPDLIAEFAKLNRYHASQVAYFLRRLKETPEGSGTLLDASLILYGSPMGDSNTHNHRNLPILLAGHANGKLKGNLHLVCEEGARHADTLLTILHKLEVDQDSIGDSTGDLPI